MNKDEDTTSGKKLTYDKKVKFTTNRKYYEDQKRRRNQRIQARSAILTLLERQQFRCYLCTKEIHSVREFTNTQLVWKNQKKLCIKEKGKKKVLLRATVDHIKSLADGGRNGMNNLAAACFSCNSKKGKKES